MGFRTSWLKMGILRAKYGKGCECDIDPNEFVSPFGDFYVCANFGENG